MGIVFDRPGVKKTMSSTRVLVAMYGKSSQVAGRLAQLYNSISLESSKTSDNMIIHFSHYSPSSVPEICDQAA